MARTSTVQNVSLSTRVTRAETLEQEGAYAIGNALQWLMELFYIPGNWALSTIQIHFPAVAQTLTLDKATPDSAVSAVLSTGAWLFAARVILVSYRAGRDIDRALTAYLVHRYAQLRIKLRTSLAWILNRLRQLRLRRSGPDDGVALRVLQSINDQDLLVLRLHAGLAPAHALTLGEIAAELDCVRSLAENIVSKLLRLQLLTPALSGCDGEDAYKLTRSGRACLRAR